MNSTGNVGAQNVLLFAYSRILIFDQTLTLKRLTNSMKFIEKFGVLWRGFSPSVPFAPLKPLFRLHPRESNVLTSN